MKCLAALLFLPLLVACAAEKDPSALSDEDAKAAAARVRPPIPKGDLPPTNRDRPIQIKLPGPDGKGGPPPVPGAVPFGNGDNLLPPPEKK